MLKLSKIKLWCSKPNQIILCQEPYNWIELRVGRETKNVIEWATAFPIAVFHVPTETNNSVDQNIECGNGT